METTKKPKTESIINIPLGSILEPKDEIRTVIVLEDLEKLAESIREVGVIHPLTVAQRGEKYEIITGHRRFLASRMAGISFLPCRVVDISAQEMDRWMIHENIFRADISAIDEARFFERVKKNYNLSWKEVAKLCGNSEAYVHQRIGILKGDPRVLAALEAGQINFTQAREIVTANSPEIRERLLDITIKEGATADSIRLMRYDYEKMARNYATAERLPTVDPTNYEEVKHLIECPTCKGKYPVNEIYPLSVCKTCYDNILTELKKDRDGGG